MEDKNKWWCFMKTTYEIKTCPSNYYFVCCTTCMVRWLHFNWINSSQYCLVYYGLSHLPPEACSWAYVSGPLTLNCEKVFFSFFLTEHKHTHIGGGILCLSQYTSATRPSFNKHINTFSCEGFLHQADCRSCRTPGASGNAGLSSFQGEAHPCLCQSASISIWAAWHLSGSKIALIV